MTLLETWEIPEPEVRQQYNLPFELFITGSL